MPLSKGRYPGYSGAKHAIRRDAEFQLETENCKNNRIAATEYKIK